MKSLFIITLLIASTGLAQETQLTPQATPQAQTQVAAPTQSSAPVPIVVNVQSPATPPPVTEKPNLSLSNPKRFYIALLVGYDTANEFKAPNTYVGVGSTQGTGEYIYGTSGAPMFGLEIGEKMEHSLGWALGYSGSPEREITSSSFSTGGVSTASADSGGNIALGILYCDGVYYFKNSYIKFGINYSFPGLRGVDAEETIDIVIDNSMGLQLGGGVFINENIALDLAYKRTDVKLSGYTATTAIDFNTLHLDGLQVALKFLF